MKVIVFDTETSGLPSATNIPTIVQFSYVKFDMTSGQIEKEVDHIIKQPSGFIVPQESINIHRITNEMCSEQGVDILGVLNQFLEDSDDCHRIIGHNVSFDMDRIASVYNKMTHSRHPVEVRKVYERKLKYLSNKMVPKLYCTMQRSIDFCNIVKINVKGRSYKKFPKLIELYEKLFNDKPTGLHNSLVDVYACLRCYLALVNNGTPTTYDLEIINKMNLLENSLDTERINKMNLLENSLDNVL
jgi:DNA polymerase III epsilon subunit-like protein